VCDLYFVQFVVDEKKKFNPTNKMTHDLAGNCTLEDSTKFAIFGTIYARGSCRLLSKASFPHYPLYVLWLYACAKKETCLLIRIFNGKASTLHLIHCGGRITMCASLEWFQTNQKGDQQTGQHSIEHPCIATSYQPPIAIHTRDPQTDQRMACPCPVRLHNIYFYMQGRDPCINYRCSSYHTPSTE
jgi:hypothetical protein